MAPLDRIALAHHSTQILERNWVTFSNYVIRHLKPARPLLCPSLDLLFTYFSTRKFANGYNFDSKAGSRNRSATRRGSTATFLS